MQEKARPLIIFPQAAPEIAHGYPERSDVIPGTERQAEQPPAAFGLQD